MKFNAMGINMVLSTIISVILAIFLSFKGFGVWALVARDISFAFFYAIGNWLLSGWIPDLPRRNSNIKPIINFGLHLSGFDIIQYFSRNVDRILIGRFIGPIGLGFYSKMQQLAFMPAEQVRSVFWGICFSPLSTLQNSPEKYHRYFSKMIFSLLVLQIPLYLFMSIYSKPIISLTLGETWSSASNLFAMFAIVGMIRPIMGIFQLVMISFGNTKKVVQWGIINGVCLILSFGIGIIWNITGLAMAYVITSYILFLWSLKFCFKNTPISPMDIIPTMMISLTVCSCSIILLRMIVKFIVIYNMLFNLIFSFAIYSILYIGLLFVFPSTRKSILYYLIFLKNFLLSKYSFQKI